MALQPLGGRSSKPLPTARVSGDRSWRAAGGGRAVRDLLPLVLTGLHQGPVPIHVELVQAHGYNALLPILSMAGVGQVGAAIAVSMKPRNARLVRQRLPCCCRSSSDGEPLISA